MGRLHRTGVRHVRAFVLFLLAMFLLLPGPLAARAAAPTSAAAQTSVVAQTSAAAQTSVAAPITLLTVDGAIGPASADYLVRGIARARRNGSQLVVMRIDTPGGLDTSMRAVIKAILVSSVPVATFVAPGGARAASAGTFIVYASHIAAMAPGTNLGAATPVAIGGGFSPDRAPEREPDRPPGGGADHSPRPDAATGVGRSAEPGNAITQAQRGSEGTASAPAAPGARDRRDIGDQRDKGDKGNNQAVPDNAMSRKALNDAVAYLQSLAQLRGRNAQWAELAVREARSLPAADALSNKVVDYVAADLRALLRQLDGRSVTVLGRDVRLATAEAAILNAEPDWRVRMLSTITDPSIALILLTVGAYGLLFEFMSPGAVAPGVIGALCLLLGLYGLHLLPINYVGLGLVLLGILFMIGEAFLPSFGVLGLGGVVAFAAGALMLIDTELPDYGIPLQLIGVLAAGSAVLIAATATVALKTRRRPAPAPDADLSGAVAEVLDDVPQPGQGWASVRGETWRVLSQAPLRRAQQVRVVERRGALLVVAPLAPGAPESRPGTWAATGTSSAMGASPATGTSPASGCAPASESAPAKQTSGTSPAT